ncbi:ABC-F family ATP-binding cassette domain-containing protein [Sutcliffiella sp. NPDC057660]|uniref:ABC-F family ATP-binding cassette domain-containing protein n=1 Tax=Sutcliffiella sp. NPDC057660 TaxID=3346199 RepID=UPI00367D6962
MIILQINQLTKYFGADLILSNIKLEVQSKDRIALVGRNGAGKSTLLKIISNQLSYDSGDIIKPKVVTIGYLAQDTGLQTERSIWDEMLTVFSGLKEMENQMRTLEAKMGDPAYFEDGPLYARILKEYDEIQEAFKQKGGFQYEADIRSVLHGLRFSEFDYQTPIETLSGGQRTRLALAKLLLTKPDLLILDEPTNHLDIDTLSWLEGYLQSYPGALLIVSHDRYFLDKVVTTVYEISRKQSAKFLGNYSAYLAQKAEQYERDMKMFEKQQDEIAKLQDFVQRNLARASTTKRAQSRRKQLDKMQMMDRPQGDEKSASIMFDIDRQSGNDVLKAKDLAVSYDRTPIFRHVDLSLSRGDSVALVGPNGIGKSTLLKTLVKQLDPLEGSFSFGANVSVSYYDQQQADLTSNKTVLAELWDEYPNKMEKEIRTILGNFLFSGDDVLKPVSTLSGGEKARLALSKMMLQRSNVLILDEPTNHLDLDSKEILENALIDYPGTILFVSHDRYFINRLATKVYELSRIGATEYLGDYDYYIEKKEEALELARLESEASSTSPVRAAQADKEKPSYEQEKEAKRLERQKKRRLEEIEKEIEEIENRLEENESQLCLPEVYQDHEKVLELNTQNEGLQERLMVLMEEWEELV